MFKKYPIHLLIACYNNQYEAAPKTGADVNAQYNGATQPSLKRKVILSEVNKWLDKIEILRDWIQMQEAYESKRYVLSFSQPVDL